MSQSSAPEVGLAGIALHPTSTPKLSLLTWNVNGLQDKIKRGLILQYLKRKAPAVTMLQETHLVGSTCKALDRWGYQLAVHSAFSTGSRGVGILIRKRFPLIIHGTFKDDQGLFAALAVQWEGRRLNFVSVYVPPALHSSALSALASFLIRLPEGDIILGGDFNMTVNDALDRTPHRPQHKQTTPLTEFLTAHGLLDVWRIQNPHQRQYTFHSGAHNSLSRIDYILMTVTDMTKIGKTEILPRGISDHSPIQAELKAHGPTQNRMYPIYPGYFQNRAIRKGLTSATSHYFQENEHSVSSSQILWEAYKPVLRGQAISLIEGRKEEGGGIA